MFTKFDMGCRSASSTQNLRQFYDPILQPREYFLIIPVHPWPLVRDISDYLKPLISVDTVRITEPSTDAQPVSPTGKKMMGRNILLLSR